MSGKKPAEEFAGLGISICASKAYNNSNFSMTEHSLP